MDGGRMGRNTDGGREIEIGRGRERKRKGR
jgi:hypothetical protein